MINDGEEKLGMGDWDEGEAFAVPLELYLEYAGDSLDLWGKIVGARLLHRSEGTGTISEIKGLTLEVQFDSGAEDILSRRSPNVEYLALLPSFKSFEGFRKFVISSENRSVAHRHAQKIFRECDASGRENARVKRIAERVRMRHEEIRRQQVLWLKTEQVRQDKEREQKEAKLSDEQLRVYRETERLQHLRREEIRRGYDAHTGRTWEDDSYQFWVLACAFDVPLAVVSPFDPSTETFAILCSINAGIEVDETDLELLAFLGAPKLNELRKIQLYQKEYAATRDPWVIAKISGAWNSFGRSDLALGWTDLIFDEDHQTDQQLPPNLLAALLTTRGASLRRLPSILEARKLAKRASQLNSARGHAYCLLGGLDVDEGLFSDADRHFAKCEELGGRSLISSQESEAKKSSEFAAYLVFEKGLRWAAKYLRR